MKNKFSFPLILVGIVNLLLFVVKLYIGIKTNSLCVYTDSINNLFDTLSAILAFGSAVFITKNATQKHPFGFGRVEYILELVMSLIITLSGVYFAYTSLSRLSMPTPIWFYFNFAIILAISCLIKLVLALVFLKLYKKNGSVIFKTIMLDSFLDCCVTLVALISFSLSNTTGIVIDGFLGLAISIMITVSGVKLVLSSVSKLVGSKDENEINSIKDTIKDIDENIEIKDIIINDYGVNSKVIILCAKTKLDNTLTLQNQIKNIMENDCYKKVYIEWEE